MKKNVLPGDFVQVPHLSTVVGFKIGPLKLRHLQVKLWQIFLTT